MQLVRNMQLRSPPPTFSHAARQGQFVNQPPVASPVLGQGPARGPVSPPLGGAPWGGRMAPWPLAMRKEDGSPRRPGIRFDHGGTNADPLSPTPRSPSQVHRRTRPPPESTPPCRRLEGGGKGHGGDEDRTRGAGARRRGTQITSQGACRGIKRRPRRDLDGQR